MNPRDKIRVLSAIAVLLAYVGIGLFIWSFIDPGTLVRYPLMVLLWPIIFDLFGAFIFLVFLFILVLVSAPEILKNRFFLAVTISGWITGLSILVPFHADLSSIQGPARGDPEPGFRGDIFSYGQPFPFIVQQSRLEKEAIIRLNPIPIAGARETPTEVIFPNLAASFAFWFLATLIVIEIIIRGRKRRLRHPGAA